MTFSNGRRLMHPPPNLAGVVIDLVATDGTVVHIVGHGERLPPALMRTAMAMAVAAGAGAGAAAPTTAATTAWARDATVLHAITAAAAAASATSSQHTRRAAVGSVRRSSYDANLTLLSTAAADEGAGTTPTAGSRRTAATMAHAAAPVAQQLCAGSPMAMLLATVAQCLPSNMRPLVIPHTIRRRLLVAYLKLLRMRHVAVVDSFMKHTGDHVMREQLRVTVEDVRGLIHDDKHRAVRWLARRYQHAKDHSTSRERMPLFRLFSGHVDDVELHELVERGVRMARFEATLQLQSLADMQAYASRLAPTTLLVRGLTPSPHFAASQAALAQRAEQRARQQRRQARNAALLLEAGGATGGADVVGTNSGSAAATAAAIVPSAGGEATLAAAAAFGGGTVTMTGNLSKAGRAISRFGMAGASGRNLRLLMQVEQQVSKPKSSPPRRALQPPRKAKGRWKHLRAVAKVVSTLCTNHMAPTESSLRRTALRAATPLQGSDVMLQQAHRKQEGEEAAPVLLRPWSFMKDSGAGTTAAGAGAGAGAASGRMTNTAAGQLKAAASARALNAVLADPQWWQQAGASGGGTLRRRSEEDEEDAGAGEEAEAVFPHLA